MRNQKALMTVIFFISAIVFSISTTGQTINRNIHDKYERKISLAKKINSLFGRTNFNKSFALVIGVSDYNGAWTPLEAPFDDAVRVRDFLISEAEFDMVVTLTNKEASLTNIAKYMEEIFPMLVSEQDRFLFYFSGHGTQRNLKGRTRGYLPMLGSTRKSWSDMISMEDIERWNENLNEAKHALFVLDCCFSGLAGTQKKTSAQELYINDLAEYGHHLITAGTANQVSFGSLKRWGGSLFTDAFLKGSSGKADAATADYPRDGVVSLTELYEYIKKRIKEEAAKEIKINQSPQVSDLGDNNGEFFFINNIDTAKNVSKRVPKKIRDKQETEGKGELKPEASKEQPSQSSKEVLGREVVDAPPFNQAHGIWVGQTVRRQPTTERRKIEITISQNATLSFRVYWDDQIVATSHIDDWIPVREITQKFVRTDIKTDFEEVLLQHSENEAWFLKSKKHGPLMQGELYKIINDRSKDPNDIYDVTLEKKQ